MCSLAHHYLSTQRGSGEQFTTATQKSALSASYTSFVDTATHQSVPHNLTWTSDLCIPTKYFPYFIWLWFDLFFIFQLTQVVINFILNI